MYIAVNIDFETDSKPEDAGKPILSDRHPGLADGTHCGDNTEHSEFRTSLMYCHSEYG